MPDTHHETRGHERRRRTFVSSARLALLAVATVSLCPVAAQDAPATAAAPVPITRLDTEQLLARAQLLLAKGEPFKALAVLDLATMRSPKSADAWFLVGKTHIEHVSARDGITALGTCRELEPDRTGIHLLLGTAFLNTGQPDKALTALRKEQAIAGDSPRLAFAVAMAHMDLKQWADAEKALSRVPPTGDPLSGRALFNLGLVRIMLKRREAGMAALERAAVEEQDPAQKKWLERHVIMAKRSENGPQEVASVLLGIRRKVGRSPGQPRGPRPLHPATLAVLSPQALRLFGRDLLRKGNAHDAVRPLKLATDKAPNDAETWFMLGAARLRVGETKASIAALERCHRLDPKRHGVHGLLAQACRSSGRYKEALGALAEEAALSGDSPLIALLAGLTYMDMEKWPEAEEQLRRVPGSGDRLSGSALFHLGLTAFERGREQAGVTLLEQAVREERDPEHRQLLAKQLTRIKEGKVTGRQLSAALRGKTRREVMGRALPRGQGFGPEAAEWARLEKTQREARLQLETIRTELAESTAELGRLTKGRQEHQADLEKANADGNGPGAAAARKSIGEIDEACRSVARYLAKHTLAMKTHLTTISVCSKQLNELRKKTGR